MQSSSLRLDKPTSLKDLKKEFKDYFLEYKLDKCIACAKEIRQHYSKQKILKLIDAIVNQYKEDQAAGWDDAVIDIDKYEADLTALLCKDENKYLLDETPPAAKQTPVLESKSAAKPATSELKEAPALSLSPIPETKNTSALTVEITSLENCIAELKSLEKSFSFEKAESIRQFLTRQLQEQDKDLASHTFPDLANDYLNLYLAYLRNDIFPPHFFDEVLDIFHQYKISACHALLTPTIEILKNFLEKFNQAAKLRQHHTIKITWLYFLDFAFIKACGAIPATDRNPLGASRWQASQEIMDFIENYTKEHPLSFSSDYLSSLVDISSHRSSDFKWIESFKNSLPYLSTLRSEERVTFSKDDFKHFPSKKDFDDGTTQLIASKETKFGGDIANKFTKLGTPICFAEYYDVMREMFPLQAKLTIASPLEREGNISMQESAILAYYYLKLLSQKAGSPSLPEFYNSGGLAQAMSGIKIAKQPIIWINDSGDSLQLEFRKNEADLTDAAIERLKNVTLLVRASIFDNTLTYLSVTIPRQEIPHYFGTLLGYEYDKKLAENTHKILKETLTLFSLDLVGIVNQYVGDASDLDLPLISADPADEYNKLYAYLDHAEKFTEQECHAVYKDILRYIEFLGPKPILWLTNIRERLSEFNHSLRIELNVMDNLNKLFKLGIRLFNYNHTFLNHLNTDEKDYINRSLVVLIGTSDLLLQKVQMQARLPSTAAGMWRASVRKPVKSIRQIHEKSEALRPR